ncbi:MAG: hypothetical protein AAGI48_00960 [Verrucomicrobiota bacterium]
MKTNLDLPRPLLLRIASQAARLRMPVSRYVAMTLERSHPEAAAIHSQIEPDDDELFEQLREELGL